MGAVFAFRAFVPGRLVSLCAARFRFGATVEVPFLETQFVSRGAVIGCFRWLGHPRPRHASHRRRSSVPR